MFITNSLFFQKSDRRFPVSLLSLEAYSISLEGFSQETKDIDFVDNLTGILQQYCFVKEPDQEDLRYFLSRLQEISDAASKIKHADTKRKKSFGTGFIDFITSLPIDRVIAKMCGYDMQLAKHIYCTLDRDLSDQLVRDYISGEVERNTVMMEASMYGFGGKYANDKSGEDKGIDINTPEGVAAMKSLGF